MHVVAPATKCLLYPTGTDGTPLEKNEKSTSNADAAVKPAAEAPRRVYVAPQLRYLGTVRDLSLGNSAGVGENKNMRMPGM